MRNYKGYAVDHIFFNSIEEIDAFLEKQAVDAYLMACELFAEHRTIGNAITCDERAERLVREFGYTWDEVVAIHC